MRTWTGRLCCTRQPVSPWHSAWACSALLASVHAHAGACSWRQFMSACVGVYLVRAAKVRAFSAPAALGAASWNLANSSLVPATGFSANGATQTSQQPASSLRCCAEWHLSMWTLLRQRWPSAAVAVAVLLYRLCRCVPEPSVRLCRPASLTSSACEDHHLSFKKVQDVPEAH